MRMHEYGNGITIIEEVSRGFWVMVSKGPNPLEYDAYPQDQHGDPDSFLPNMEAAIKEAERLDALGIAYKS